MNDYKMLQNYLDSGDFDSALKLAHQHRHHGDFYSMIAANTDGGIPSTFFDKFLESVPRAHLSQVAYELSNNLHPEISNQQLHSLWKKSNSDGLVEENLLAHENFVPTSPSQKATGEFWSSYERKVEPSHFAAIKSMYTGEPEFLETHRAGAGHSSAHDEAIPHLVQHMQDSQNAVLGDKSIEKKYINGKPHVKVYRGVGGSYAKHIKESLGVQDSPTDLYLQDGSAPVKTGLKSGIDKHKSVTVPAAHMSSWTLDNKMAERFATSRGEHDSEQEPHHVVIEKMIPIESILHTGIHQLYPGQYQVHPSEQELVVAHPTGDYKVSTRDLHVGQKDAADQIQFTKLKPPKIQKSYQLQKSDMINVSSVAVLSNGMILMGKRKDTNKWTLPSGHQDPGESPIECANREVWEESGLQAIKLRPIASEVCLCPDGIKRRINAFVSDYDGSTPTSKNDPDNEVSVWSWFDFTDGLPKEILNNLYSPKNVTLKALGLLDYSE